MSSEQKSAADQAAVLDPGHLASRRWPGWLVTGDGGALIVEFEVKYAVLGLLRSGVEVVGLPVDELASVSVDQSLAAHGPRPPGAAACAV